MSALETIQKVTKLRSVLPAITAAFVLTLLWTTTAHAGVEFVTEIGQCSTHKTGTINIIAGVVRFEVWGNSVDLSNPTSGFRVDNSSGPFSARITRQHNGAENTARGCGLIGSAEVEVNSPTTLTDNISRTLFFKMPLGDESPLALTIKAFPTINATWTSTQADISCIVNTAASGSFTKINQDHGIKLQLPLGHLQDQTTCSSNTLRVAVAPSIIGTLDIPVPAFKYNVSGLPPFLTESQPIAQSVQVGATLVFAVDVIRIRSLTSTSNSTITVTTPGTNRTSTLTFEVIPNVQPGFVAAATCNPSSLLVGNTTDCTLTVFFPPSASGFRDPITSGRTTTPLPQPITWRWTTATCFTQAVAEAPYNPNNTFQVFFFPIGQTSAIIRTRTVNNGNCSSKTGVNQVFEAWIGDFRSNPQVTATTSAPNYTRTNITLLSPPTP